MDYLAQTGSEAPKKAEFPNPYPSGDSRAFLFELLRDGEWHTKNDPGGVRDQMQAKGWNRLLSSRLDALEKEGLYKQPPKYPNGRWRLHRKRGQIRLVLNEALEAPEIDNQELRKQVVTIMKEVFAAQQREQIRQIIKEELAFRGTNVGSGCNAGVPGSELRK